MWIDITPWDWARYATGRPTGTRRRLVDGYIGRPSDPGPRRTGESATERAQIERCIRSRGWRVGRVVEETVSTESQPLLRAALERIQAGESDGIVVYRLDHLGSSLIAVLAPIERITAAGGLLISLCDGLEFGIRSGKRTFWWSRVSEGLGSGDSYAH